MSPALVERLVAVARAARRAGHGNKAAIYKDACEKLGMSRNTLLRKLKEVSVTRPRKQRKDAGQCTLTREEAEWIVGITIESGRRNKHRMMPLADVVNLLRKSGKILAGRVDEETGEFFPLSLSAIGRALDAYGLAPRQLTAPDPVTEMASRHPNHVWQVDASNCTLWFLSNGRRRALKEMDQSVHYKNKPENLERIKEDRVWRYVITDHASGWIFVRYVLGAESGENLCDTLIEAMQARGGYDALHGVPKILMMDLGAANTAAMTRNLCHNLGIEVIPHEQGNPRANGQVENAQNLVETHFEAGLKFRNVDGLGPLNAMGRTWRMYYCQAKKHGRHGMSRTDAWRRIREAELILAPSVEECRALAIADPEPRQVTSKLRVSFHGKEYDVSAVPDVMVDEKLLVIRDPWRDDAAKVVLRDEDGHEIYHAAPRVEKGEYGFAKEAAIIGEAYRRAPDTRAQTARKSIERLATGADTPQAARKVRKEMDKKPRGDQARPLPFRGEIDPYRHMGTDHLPTPLPRRGTEHGRKASRVIEAPLNHVQAAGRLKERLGDAWTRAHYQALVARFPDGVPPEEIGPLAEELQGGATPGRKGRPRLRLVG
uniref:Integrase core domain-containing protein n=1 Tax=Candidatus Kentrum sp. LPFa TaxID=2126335 RepID=A0A450WD88_9GAMM|nr:MAG: Integrase core domain-containing protein [Candidatus Kentron sp. LPFa]